MNYRELISLKRRRADIFSNAEPSWGALADKPFGNIHTGSDTLTWDGNTEGRYSFVYTGLTFVHVSNSTPAVSELQGAKVLVGYGVSESDYTIPAVNINILGDVIHIAGEPQMVVALTDNAKFYNKIIEKAGLYFSTTFGKTPVTYATLTISGYDGFPADKPIDAKYLPEGYPSYDPVGGRNLVYEWSGTLERNSSSGTYMLDIANTNKKLLTIGTTYAVTFGGKEFICVCGKNKAQNPCLGTQTLRPRAETEPFYINVNTRSGVIHVEADTGTYASTAKVTFSISEIVPLTVPIDEKFLPDSVKGGGGGITYLYAEGNRLYTDIDRTEEVEYVDDFWLDQLDLGRMVIIRDVENDYSPNLLTNAGGMVAYCGNKVFYSQGYMGEPS